MRQSLDGRWEFRPVAGDAGGGGAPPGEGFESTRIHVPGYWNSFPAAVGGDWGAYDHYRYPAHWQQAQAAWYRLRFRADPGLFAGAARRLLTFDAVAGRSTVWLNGTRLGGSSESFLPFRFDVSDALAAGENELQVLVEPPPQKDGLWLQPCGSWVGWFLRGIWQSVHLDAEPELAIADLAVRTSVRADRLDLHVDCPPGAAELSGGRIRVTLLDGERVVADLGTQPLAGADAAAFALASPGLRHWSPETPKLYALRAEALLGERCVHSRTVRFGFREFWIDGEHFVLNGRRLRLFGDSWHYMGAAQQNPSYARTWMRFARQAGVNVIRTHAMPYPPCYFDIADELGLLVIAETAVYGSAGTLAYDEPAFWESCRAHMRDMVRRDRNHPSIVMWSACNETVWKGGERIYPELLSLGAAARELDPTRIVSYDENDCDLGGGSPVHAGHYGTPQHWRRAWRRDRPLTVHEFSSLYHGGPESVSHIGGDAVYTDYAARLRAAGEDAADMFMRLRALGAASITPWNLNWYCLEPGPVQAIEEVPAAALAGGPPLERIGPRALTLNYGYAPDAPAWVENPAYAPLAACYRRRRLFVERRPRQGFAGQMLTFTVRVFNDASDPAELRLTARLDGGAAVERDVRLAACASTEITLAFELPALEANSVCTCELLLGEHAQPPLYRETWSISVWPAPSADTRAPRPVWKDAAGTADDLPAELFDDPGATLTLARPPGQPLRAWLEQEQVDRWLRAGGRVVVLPGGLDHDDTSDLAPLKRACERAFVRDRGGLLADLEDGHFRDWPGGVVAQALFQRPQAGTAATPLECGDPSEGLAYAPLVIVPRGRGHVVLCGLPLHERAADTPAAALLLERLSQSELPGPPARSAAVMADDAGLSQLLAEAGLEPADGGDVLICDGGDPQLLERGDLTSAALGAHLTAGGDLLLLGVTPETSAAWAARLGVDPARLALREEACCNVGVGGDNPLLRGVNSFDLCWVNRDEKQPVVRHTLPIGDTPAAITTVATRWDDYQLTAEQHKVALMLRRIASFAGPRAALVEVTAGRGRVIVCQLLLAEARGSFRPRARRVLSRLLDNLGVERAARVDPLQRRARAIVDADGYVRQWLALGPFAGGAEHPLDHAFVDEGALAPADGAAAGGATWSRVASGFAQVDLTARAGPHDGPRVLYAAVYVYSPQDRAVLLDAPDMVALLAGADGGVKVLLNGVAVGRFDFVREFVADSDRVNGLPLRRGWNTLVIKLHNPGGPWRFAVRLRNIAGEAAGDLRYALALPAEEDQESSER